MCHPLITAWNRYKEAADLSLRTWSPYYPQWLQLLDEHSKHLQEVNLFLFGKQDNAKNAPGVWIAEEEIQDY